MCYLIIQNKFTQLIKKNWYLLLTIGTDFEAFWVEGFRFLAGVGAVVWGLTDCLPAPVDGLIARTSLRLKLHNR